MSNIVYFFPFGRYLARRANRSPRVGTRRYLYYVLDTLCLLMAKLFLVLFKYFIVIIEKVEMLYVVLNIIACYQAQHGYIITFLVDQS